MRSTAVLTVDPGPEGALAFERILFVVLLTEHWTRALALRDALGVASAAYLATATIACVAGLVGVLRSQAWILLAVVQLLILARDFPQAGNHAYLELILCTLLAMLDPRSAPERRLLVPALRWIVCLVLFWSGVQKLVHGYYFGGEELAYSLWIESFRPVFGLILPAEELARLAAYTGAVDDGPYRSANALFAAISNFVYAAEIGLAILLPIRVTRSIATVAAAMFLVAIEIAAREVFFGMLFLNGLLLFSSGPLHRRSTAAFAALCLCLFLVRLGVLPYFTFY